MCCQVSPKHSKTLQTKAKPKHDLIFGQVSLILQFSRRQQAFTNYRQTFHSIFVTCVYQSREGCYVQLLTLVMFEWLSFLPSMFLCFCFFFRRSIMNFLSSSYLLYKWCLKIWTCSRLIQIWSYIRFTLVVTCLRIGLLSVCSLVFRE